VEDGPAVDDGLQSCLGSCEEANGVGGVDQPKDNPFNATSKKVRRKSTFVRSEHSGAFWDGELESQRKERTNISIKQFRDNSI
jgi:hypothetical protein